MLWIKCINQFKRKKKTICISQQTLAVFVLKVPLIMSFAILRISITSSYSNSDSMLL